MSAVPRHPGPPSSHAGLRMTADDFLALGETPERYQLIDGVVVMSPSPTPNHSEIINEIVYQLMAFSRASTPLRVFSETDLRLDDDLVYQPDIAVYLGHRLADPTPRLDMPPDLVVEVLSPTNRSLDLVTKRHDYSTFGVGEYWIIDPDSRQVRLLQRPAAGDSFAESLASADALPSAAIPGFTLDLAPVRGLLDRARPPRQVD